MTTIKQNLFCILCLILFVSILSSCGTRDVLELKSEPFAELEAKPIDETWLKNRYISGETYCYNGPSYVIGAREGEIFLEPYKEKGSHLCNLNNYYLVGVDCGEFDGWVSVVEYMSNYFDENGKSYTEKRIINENCRGFLNRKYKYIAEDGEYWIDDLNTAYIFTGLAHMDTDEGKIYKFTVNGMEWDVELFCDLESSPNAFMMDEDNIVVVTEKSLLSIDPEGNIEELYSVDYWWGLGANSIVKIDNKYFIGTTSGIYRYDIDSRSVTWYPYYDEEE